MSVARTRLGCELLQRFAAALRAGQLYSKGHPIVGRNLESLSGVIRLLHGTHASTVVGLVGDDIVVDDEPVSKSESFEGLVGLLKKVGIERVTIDRGVAPDEIAALMEAVIHGTGPEGGFPTLPHVRVGRISVEERSDPDMTDTETLRSMYRAAVANAEIVWESARVEAQVDATVAGSMVDGLADAVSQNRRALLALTTLRGHDNYTFTHMVNVSILAMGQARGLGISGPLLREIGMAALMHDIGKVRTPLEVLNKPDKLTDAETAIMKRHPMEGAEILRATPEMPVLAPIVAFEHHLRLDGSGYPTGADRRSLNIGTMLCSIADVFDAMRSKRQYQQSSPTDRILEVLKRNDGSQFDPHLVRRFTQLIGIYPVGNLVRLNTGEIAVVTKVYAPDARRPQVKILTTANGSRLEAPYEACLWDIPAAHVSPRAIIAPVDPAELDVDPLTFI